MRKCFFLVLCRILTQCEYQKDISLRGCMSSAQGEGQWIRLATTTTPRPMLDRYHDASIYFIRWARLKDKSKYVYVSKISVW